MNESKDKGYTFKCDFGDKIYHLNTPLVIEREDWIYALEKSRATAKEQKKSKAGLSKNISVILSCADKGKQQLIEKIESDYKSIQEKYIITNPSDLDDILRQQDALAKDLISTLDACLAHEPPRKDIIEEYIPIYHQKICTSLSDYFKDNVTQIQNLDIIQLINWLHKYYDSLKPYGLNDERLITSVSVLSLIFSKRMFKTNAEMTFAVLKTLRDSTPIEGGEGLKQTSGPLDLFKIVNETLEAYNRSKHPEVAERLIKITKDQIFYYQSNLDLMIDKLEFSVPMYIGLCNDTIIYIKNINEAISSLNKMTGIEIASLEEVIGKDEILRRFSEMGKKSYEKLIDVSFKNLEGYFQVIFSDLDLEKTLGTIFDLHKLFKDKVWRVCLDKIVLLYTQCLIKSGGKMKLQKMEELNDKIKKERDTLKGSFSDVLTKVPIESSVKVLEEIIEFLEASPDVIFMNLLTLRKTHGPGFTANTVAILLKLRFDIDSATKKSIITESKPVLAGYKDEKKDFKGFFEKLEVDEEIDVYENDEDQSVNSQKSEESVREETPKSAEPQKEDKKEKLGLKTYAGYMEKKFHNLANMVGSSWHLRYYSIKNDKLYWYKNDRSREAQGTIEIRQIQKIEVGKDCRFDFVANSKKYELRTRTIQERDKWVKLLQELIVDLENEELKLKMDNEVFATISGESFFADTEPEWVPNPQERADLLRREKALLSHPGLNCPEEEEAKKNPLRKKSLTFDDIPSFESGPKNDYRPTITHRPTQTKIDTFEIENPKQPTPNADAGVNSPFMHCYEQLLLVLGIKTIDEVQPMKF